MRALQVDLLSQLPSDICSESLKHLLVHSKTSAGMLVLRWCLGIGWGMNSVTFQAQCLQLDLKRLGTLCYSRPAVDLAPVAYKYGLKGSEGPVHLDVQSHFIDKWLSWFLESQQQTHAQAWLLLSNSRGGATMSLS